LRGGGPEALTWQKKAALPNPKSSTPSYIFGWSYRLLGEHDMAERWLKKAIDQRSLSDACRELAYTYISQEENDKALALIPSVLSLEKGNSRVYEIAGIIADYAGDTTRATEYYQQSMSLNESVNTDPQTVSPIGLGRLCPAGAKSLPGKHPSGTRVQANRGLPQARGGNHAHRG